MARLRAHYRRSGAGSQGGGGRAIAACARGAQAIADAGWVHRDIKPGNVLLDEFGVAKLGDFGLAKAIADGAPGGEDLTRAGCCVGTPAYLAPEVVRRGRADARSDLYALGATLFHLVAGRPPHDGATPGAVLRAVALDQDRAPLPADCPPDLARVITTAMARDPAHRYPCADDLADDCERVLAGHRPRGRRRFALPSIPWSRLLPRPRRAARA